MPRNGINREKEADALESAKRDAREMLKTAELLENSINGSTDNNFTSTWHENLKKSGMK